MTKKFWLWVDGQKRWYDYPPDPPGYTVEQIVIIQWMRELDKRRKESEWGNG